MTHIRTNKIILKEYGLDTKYGVIVATHKDAKYAWRSEILDAFDTYESGVRALCYRDGATYVLAESDKVGDVRKLIAGMDKAGTFSTIFTTTLSELQKAGRSSIDLQLLLNALPSIGQDPDIQTVNLTGRMQCHHNAWKQKDGSRKPIYIMLDIYVDKDMLLNLDVVTYSSVPKGYVLKDQPVYALDQNGFMRRCFDFKHKELFLKKRFDGGKSEVPFLCIQDEMEFMKSKMGILERIITRFNETYSGFAEISFEYGKDISCSESLQKAIDKFKKGNKAVTERWREDNPYITVKDMVKTDYSSELSEQISTMLNGDTAPDGSTGPEFHLIHDAEWYRGQKLKDPHSSSSSERGVQHLTLETIAFGGNLSGAIKSILESCINNLIVKDDLSLGKMSLGGDSLTLDEDMRFGVVVLSRESEDSKDAVIMTIHPNKTIEFNREKVNPLTMSQDKLYSYLCTSYADNTRGVIMKGDSMMVLEDTPMFTIPEIEWIRKEMADNARDKSKCKVSRSAEARQKFFTAVTDINRFRMDDSDEVLYNVGIIGSGMNTTIQRGSRVRRLRLITGKDFSEELLVMLTDAHVRNGQLTVIPFPFKYLNEYCGITE